MSQIAGQGAAIASGDDIQQGRLLAVLGYVVPLVAVLPLIKRDNDFALFHAKQALTLDIVVILACFVVPIVMLLLPVAIVVSIVSLGILCAFEGLLLYGAFNAFTRRRKALPLVGGLAAAVFRSFTVRA